MPDPTVPNPFDTQVGKLPPVPAPVKPDPQTPALPPVPTPASVNPMLPTPVVAALPSEHDALVEATVSLHAEHGDVLKDVKVSEDGGTITATNHLNQHVVTSVDRARKHAHDRKMKTDKK